MHTESVRPKVVTGEAVHLRKLTTMDRTNVQEILPTFPH